MKRSRLMLLVFAFAMFFSLEGFAQGDKPKDQKDIKPTTPVNLGKLPQGLDTNYWWLTGNSGTDRVFNFLGTTDAQPLFFRTNNVERMVIDDQGMTWLRGPLSADGLLISKNGGVRFPDGTVQTTAQIRGPKGDTGLPGLPGPQGPKGDPGSPAKVVWVVCVDGDLTNARLSAMPGIGAGVSPRCSCGPNKEMSSDWAPCTINAPGTNGVCSASNPQPTDKMPYVIEGGCCLCTEK